ncbi:MAG: twin-arginine translocase TatA/TatE family subunit [Chromatiales bacterium]|nr:twin-arginine translocase TatA/TatE family subunit [Chromatiales bacterium]
MGISGISIWQLLIVLLIVLLIFGTKRLKGLGTDLGGALKGFRKAMSDAEDTEQEVRRQIEQPDAEFGESSKSEQESHRHS